MAATMPSAPTLERRLARERRVRREAEAIAEQVTSELYEAVCQLTAFKAVLDETTDFVAITDLDGRPSYLNRALAELLGVDEDDLEAVNLVELLTAQSRARYQDEATPVLHEKGLWRGEFAWARPGGGELAVSQVLIAHRTVDGRIQRVSSVSRDVTEQQALHEQLAHQAAHDPLTGLANRRLFFDRLDLAQARAIRAGTILAVLFLDLDGFKGVNDTLGHEMGDDVLVTVAARLGDNMRAADTLARFGGDEFAVVCEDVSDTAHAVDVAHRLVEAVGRPIVIGDTTVQIGASVGVAVATEPIRDLDELIRQADAAMYRAKAMGKGGMAVFQSDA